MEKRERNVNYTQEETERLVQLLLLKKHIIENKKSDSVTWQAKEHAWQAIQSEFNSFGTGTYRDARQLKLKYEALKRDTRKKIRAARAECYKTGGRTNSVTSLTPVEIKLKNMILMSEEGKNLDHLEAKVKADEDPLVVEISCDQPMGLNTLDDSNTELGYSDKRFMKSPCASESEASTSKVIESEVENLEPATKKMKWKQTSLKSKRHPALSKEKEKKPFHRLAEAKIEITELQKRIIQEEMTEKVLRSTIMKLELEHKKEMFRLEREESMLKIEILKVQLENLKKDK